MEKATEMKVSPDEPFGWLWNKAIENDEVTLDRMTLIVLISFYWANKRDARYFEDECWKLREKLK